MNTIKQVKTLPRIINRGIYNSPKTPLGFHMVPYDQQYETRDSKYLVGKISDKTLQNRKNYIKDFNPYLKSNVSDNLAHSLKDFYMKRYSQR